MTSPHPHQAQLTMLTTHIRQLWQTHEALSKLADAFSAPLLEPSIWQLLTGVPVTSMDVQMAERERERREIVEKMAEVVAEIRAWDERIGALLV